VRPAGEQRVGAARQPEGLVEPEPVDDVEVEQQVVGGGHAHRGPGAQATTVEEAARGHPPVELAVVARHHRPDDPGQLPSPPFVQVAGREPLEPRLARLFVVVDEDEDA
jgi:hypothetical protein